jgi:serine/threonine protein kinase
MTARNVCPTCSTAYPVTQHYCKRDGSALVMLDRPERLSLGTIMIAGRYRVTARLGEGSTSTVFLAEHVTTHRISALKILNPGLVADAESVSRFHRDAANAGRISHPNVVEIHDFGETGERTLFLAMEFVKGEALSLILAREQTLPPARVAAIVRQAAAALAAAHELGIIHRDLKPDNILIATGQSGDDIIKVADFGLAKMTHALEQKRSLFGAVIGTPAYMSPEQASGEALDARTDIYSLGLVTFRMLAGALPFGGGTASSAVRARPDGQPRTLTDVRPDVAWTTTLQRVFDRVLAVDRRARFATAPQFAEALVEVLGR